MAGLVAPVPFLEAKSRSQCDNFQAAGLTSGCPYPSCSGHVSGEAPVPEGLRQTPAMLPVLLAQMQAKSQEEARAGEQVPALWGGATGPSRIIFCFQFCDPLM